uniref:Uncharacterized protein n=1 Tax=viral metagenome TaxID=1070528 RepID=A0A6M3KXS4_9ZZZZ
MRTPEQEKQWQEAVESVAKQIFNKYRHFTWPVWEEYNNIFMKQNYREFADQILSNPLIAVIDSDQELSVNSYRADPIRGRIYKEAQLEMKLEGWVKIVSKEVL